MSSTTEQHEYQIDTRHWTGRVVVGPDGKVLAYPAEMPSEMRHYKSWEALRRRLYYRYKTLRILPRRASLEVSA